MENRSKNYKTEYLTNKQLSRVKQNLINPTVSTPHDDYLLLKRKKKREKNGKSGEYIFLSYVGYDEK